MLQQDAELIPGWLLERAVPRDLVAGLATGEYALHGGVVRWAAGSEKAGQIVRHIVPVAANLTRASAGDPLALLNLAHKAAVHVGQWVQYRRTSAGLDAVQDAIRQTLAMSTRTMVLAGFNLTVTAVGFATLSSKLNSLEGRLRGIEDDVKEIKAILHGAEQANLRAAIRDLLKVTPDMPEEHRHTMLHNARRTLGGIHERHAELLASAADIDAALAYEEYFCVTALARARCTAELGMFEMARSEFSEDVEIWAKHGKRIARELLLRDEAERFIASDFADRVPIASLASWLDFAHDEAKGYDWIDELRRKTPQLYETTVNRVIPQITFRRGDLTQETEKVVPALERLVNRNAVLAGYVGQYETMEQAELTPSEFETRLRLPEEDLIDGYAVIRPAEAPQTNGLRKLIRRSKETNGKETNGE